MGMIICYIYWIIVVFGIFNYYFVINIQCLNIWYDIKIKLNVIIFIRYIKYELLERCLKLGVIQ